jgi:hypothetical protein
MNITKNIKSNLIIYNGLYYIWLIILLYNCLVRVPEFDKYPPSGASYLRAGLLFWTVVFTLIHLIVMMGFNFYHQRKITNNFQYILIPMIAVIIIIYLFQIIK